MSYAADIKSAICLRDAQKNCCRKAFLNGFLFTSATHSEKQISVKLSGTEAQTCFLSLTEQVLHTAVREEACRGGGNTKLFSFSSASASRYLQELEDHEQTEALSLRCEECKRWFLRGIFLSCGRPTDPKKSFRLDLVPYQRLTMLENYLTSIGIEPLRRTARGVSGLYYRSGERIGDFFAMMGENDIYFALQNVFFEKELNNVTNRQNNCTIGNLMRSVVSGGELIDLLTRMSDRNKLSLLPDELKSTAELRLKYPSYTVTQLAAASVPPLTKSGVNHRLRRILEIARKLDL